MKIENLDQVLGIFVTAVRAAQAKGAYTLEDAAVIQKAIDWLAEQAKVSAPAEEAPKADQPS